MKILNTRNYRLFNTISGENRPLDMKKHRNLEESMKQYGFLPCYPIIVSRDKDNALVIEDGQHRFAIAEKLGLAVYYVEVKVDFDVAKVNKTIERWMLQDYARKHAANGLKAYEEGLQFAEQHGLPVGIAFSLLCGHTGFTNFKEQFYQGTFKVKDKQWADAVANVYTSLIQLSRAVRGTRLIEACMGICRVPEFDAKRLLKGAERCREKLIPYSTKDAYLQMLEDIYNFHRSQLFGLKNAAIMAMRERNAVEQKKAGAAAKRQNGNRS